MALNAWLIERENIKTKPVSTIEERIELQQRQSTPSFNPYMKCTDRRLPHCHRCRIHGVAALRLSHLRCPYAKCTCPVCQCNKDTSGRFYAKTDNGDIKCWMSKIDLSRQISSRSSSSSSSSAEHSSLMPTVIAESKTIQPPFSTINTNPSNPTTEYSSVKMVDLAVKNPRLITDKKEEIITIDSSFDSESSDDVTMGIASVIHGKRPFITEMNSNAIAINWQNPLNSIRPMGMGGLRLPIVCVDSLRKCSDFEWNTAMDLSSSEQTPIRFPVPCAPSPAIRSAVPCAPSLAMSLPHGNGRIQKNDAFIAMCCLNSMCVLGRTLMRFSPETAAQHAIQRFLLSLKKDRNRSAELTLAQEALLHFVLPKEQLNDDVSDCFFQLLKQFKGIDEFYTLKVSEMEFCAQCHVNLVHKTRLFQYIPLNASDLIPLPNGRQGISEAIERFLVALRSNGNAINNACRSCGTMETYGELILKRDRLHRYVFVNFNHPSPKTTIELELAIKERYDKVHIRGIRYRIVTAMGYHIGDHGQVAPVAFCRSPNNKWRAITGVGRAMENVRLPAVVDGVRFLIFEAKCGQ